MAKKLVIFMASAGVAAAIAGAYASRRHRAGSTPLLETAVGDAKKLANGWRANDDELNNEFATVVADEVAAAH